MHSNLSFTDQIRLLTIDWKERNSSNYALYPSNNKIHDHERGYPPRSFGGPLRIERKYTDGGKERGKERSVEKTMQKDRVESRV